MRITFKKLDQGRWRALYPKQHNVRVDGVNYGMVRETKAASGLYYCLVTKSRGQLRHLDTRDQPEPLDDAKKRFRQFIKENWTDL